MTPIPTLFFHRIRDRAHKEGLMIQGSLDRAHQELNRPTYLT